MIGTHRAIDRLVAGSEEINRMKREIGTCFLALEGLTPRDKNEKKKWQFAVPVTSRGAEIGLWKIDLLAEDRKNQLKYFGETDPSRLTSRQISLDVSSLKLAHVFMIYDALPALIEACATRTPESTELYAVFEAAADRAKTR